MFKIIINSLQDESLPCVATIGNFDGMHLGHMQLISRLNDVMYRDKYRRTVITFEPLPLEYFADCSNSQRLPRLSLMRDKFKVLKSLGFIDEFIILRFNTSLSNMSPADFIDDILIKKLGVLHVVIGHDFKFGKNGAGNIADFHKAEIETTEIKPYFVNGNRVSSSIVREYASENNLEQLRRYLGRNIHYTSRVIYGNQLGRKFGVPTINLCLGKNKPALWGIFVAVVYIDGVRYNAVASIGKNPTVSNLDTYKLEAHLLDVDLDLYGKIATVEILKFLREERKFDDLDTLFKQIHLDLSQSREYFKLQDK